MTGRQLSSGGLAVQHAPSTLYRCQPSGRPPSAGGRPAGACCGRCVGWGGGINAQPHAPPPSAVLPSAPQRAWKQASARRQHHAAGLHRRRAQRATQRSGQAAAVARARHGNTEMEIRARGRIPDSSEGASREGCVAGVPPPGLPARALRRASAPAAPPSCLPALCAAAAPAAASSMSASGAAAAPAATGVPRPHEAMSSSSTCFTCSHAAAGGHTQRHTR